MSTIRKNLISYGIKIVRAGLTVGAGGNISAREGNIIWMKPSGYALDDIKVEDLCGINLKTGRTEQGKNKPTSEVNMHLAIYRQRPEVVAVFHTHSPWASGVISAGVKLKPMFAEFVCDLGRIGYLPYITPTTLKLANAVGKMVRTCDTLFLANHGIIALGLTMKQAFYRCVVVEDAAKSLVAASCVGKPQFFNKGQIKELMGLDSARHRIQIMEK